MKWKSLMVGALITVCLGVSSWTLNAVANMPKDFVLKEDAGVAHDLLRQAIRDLHSENREDHKEILDLLRNK